MKQITIKNFHSYEVQKHREGDGKDILVWGLNDMSVSDGYHTVDELYEHRITLWIALCKHISSLRNILRTALKGTQHVDIPESIIAWRSKLHSDGTSFDGWFVLGVGKAKGEQITYHLPVEKWDQCDFAETLEKAPEFDGHTSADVLERIKNL